MSARSALRSALAGVGLLIGAADARAQCTGVNHVTWPAVNPVWDFCWVAPPDSSAANGSGIELVDVKYNGTLILARAHIPILNVKYTNVGNPFCGGPNFCYRDWLYTENAFQCLPVPSPGYCTGESTPASSNPSSLCAGGHSCTVCDHPGTDAGTFTGVAVEDFGTSLRLTSQCSAGWYRYIPVWEFFPDGTIQARFDATSVGPTCVSYTHSHHAYWRFDFDVNGSAGNYVDQVFGDGSTQRVTTERNFADTSPARGKWRIGNAGSPHYVEVNRNAGDGAAGDASVVPNDFPIADGWVLAYSSAEFSDTSRVSGCGAGLDAFDDNQNVDGADVVLWVRAGSVHEGESGSQTTHCIMFGPTIRVLPVAPPVSAANYNTVTPCRIVDTRNSPGAYGGPALQAAATRSFVISGQCGVPATAKSVSANLTVTEPSAGGHLTAFPAGFALPLASTLNFSAGQTRANNAILPLGTGGAISVQSVLSSGTVHFILDVTGWFE